MSTVNPIEVDVDLTFGDFYKANLGMSLYFLRYLIGAVAIAALLWASCLAVSLSRYAWSDNADSLAQWLFPLVVGAVPTVLILVPTVSFIRAKQMLRPERDDGKRQYLFSEEGIKVQARLANADVKWEAFRQVRETRRYFLLFAAPGFANVVPKRCFPSDTSVSEFRSLVRRQVRKFKLRN
jgi:hypothetical protein